ncbi:MAG: hypothetical protein QM541_01455 [Flavobacterium sp.]|nr:hypothetical protein [Flavobacterium sp.]
MATSFITKDNVYGFWINDSLMQVICWGLVSIIDEVPPTGLNNWLKTDFREIINDNSQGIFSGFMNLRFDEFLINQERENLFKDILYKTKKFFLSKGDYIPTNELNDFQLVYETKREWLYPLDTKRLIKVLNFILNVVNENIYIKEDDDIDYGF